MKIFKDILKVSFSNFVKLFSGILVGFLLPKIIGVSDYGYYKTFTLYASYVGLFGLGIIDGIYLKYGGKAYNELNREKFRLYSKIIIFIQAFFCVAGIVLSYLLFEGELRFIFICNSLYLFTGNITGYYQIMSQITGRFTELFLRNIVYSVLTAFSVLILWGTQKLMNIEITYRYYTVMYVCIFGFLAIWYSFTYKDITYGESAKLSDNWRQISYFIKTGIPLLVANLCATFILTLDRQFVNILFDNMTYAIYAFAYNMLALVTTATGAISTVIFPTLKQKNEEELISNFSYLVNLILVVVFACVLIYYPLCWCVDLFLPKYHDSLVIFRIIFPGLAISSAVTIVMHNYYKAIGENMRYFVYSVIILIISGVANYIAYAWFKTTAAISIASVITLLVWYLLAQHYFIVHYKIVWVKNLLYILIMLSLFYVITNISNYYIGFVIHVVSFFLITMLFNRKEISNFYLRRKKK